MRFEQNNDESLSAGHRHAMERPPGLLYGQRRPRAEPSSSDGIKTFKSVCLVTKVGETNHVLRELRQEIDGLAPEAILAASASSASGRLAIVLAYQDEDRDPINNRYGASAFINGHEGMDQWLLGQLDGVAPEDVILAQIFPERPRLQASGLLLFRSTVRNEEAHRYRRLKSSNADRSQALAVLAKQMHGVAATDVVSLGLRSNSSGGVVAEAIVRQSGPGKQRWQAGYVASHANLFASRAVASLSGKSCPTICLSRSRRQLSLAALTLEKRGRETLTVEVFDSEDVALELRQNLEGRRRDRIQLALGLDQERPWAVVLER